MGVAGLTPSHNCLFQTWTRTLLQNADDQVLLLRHRGEGGVDSSSAARRQLRLRGRQVADLLLARGAQGEDHVRPAAYAHLGWGGAGTVDGDRQVRCKKGRSCWQD